MIELLQGHELIGIPFRLLGFVLDIRRNKEAALDAFGLPIVRLPADDTDLAF